jgi:branched-chain amino acid transport system ATP-binding protein
MGSLLELRNLRKNFGRLVAVSDLSLTVQRGETLGLIGPNGSGKTTTFNLIMRELKQDEGEIFLRKIFGSALCQIR